MKVHYFHPLTFGMTVSIFGKRFIESKVVFSTKFDFFDHVYLLKTKSEEIIPNVAKIDNLNLL